MDGGAHGAVSRLRGDAMISRTPLVNAKGSEGERFENRKNERGSITFFGIGMVMVLLFVGGVSTDLWRVFGERRALAEMADSAAAAGSNALDVDAYRSGGVLRLDPTLAEAYAWASLEQQGDRQSLSGQPEVLASTTGVVVVVHGEVELTLLQIFAPGEPLQITVTAESAPTRGLGP